MTADNTPEAEPATLPRDVARRLSHWHFLWQFHGTLHYVLGIIGVIAVIAFVVSGIMYITAAGNEEQVEKAKEIMTYAIIGLVIALLGLTIVNAIAGLTGAAGGGVY